MVQALGLENGYVILFRILLSVWSLNHTRIKKWSQNGYFLEVCELVILSILDLW